MPRREVTDTVHVEPLVRKSDRCRLPIPNGEGSVSRILSFRPFVAGTGMPPSFPEDTDPWVNPATRRPRSE